MNESFSKVIEAATRTLSLEDLLGFFLAVGVVFSILERLFPASKRPLIRAGVGLDLFYWFFTPVITKIITNFALAIAVVSVLLIFSMPFDEKSLNGFGPVSRQPQWLQMIEILLLGDLIGYWMHRWFHVTWLWRFHAVHHSPKQLDWLSAYRMHPINDILSRIAQSVPLLMVGYSPNIIIAYVPFISAFVVFLHTNIAWTWGPFKYVFASPTFHRWHHSSEPGSIDRNYATFFPFYDLLFGTFFLPDRQPTRYGVKDNSVPDGFLGQMLHPFVWKGPQAQAEANTLVQATTQPT
jgi:sterol desaturase/sphingolipid hydroxylase (fatty acid hydroxylase superfamily)